MHKVLIALGGNEGDVLSTFERACTYLSCDILNLRKSSPYRTAPVYDKPGVIEPAEKAPDYWNAAICGQTFYGPEELLERLLAVEAHLGRKRPAPDCSPRPIDLDLLLFDDLIVYPETASELTLPHPRMHTRLFVMDPVCDIAADWLHPVLNKTLAEIRDDLRKASQA